MRRPKKHLSFGSLLTVMSEVFEGIPDSRQEGKIDYSLRDAMMCGFAMMFFQDPSMLQFQTRMKEEYNSCNLETIFGVKSIPSDTQIRDIIDTVNPENFDPIFKSYTARLQRGKHLEQYQLFPGLYAIPIDGSEYFSSNKIHCPGCLEKKHTNGTISYAHQILQAAIVHPGMRQVIPLMAEEIRNTDGNKKQDCEINAAKRLLRKIRTVHPQLGIIIIGDGLYSKQPAIDLMEMLRLHYILVAKEKDHKFMMEYLEERENQEKIYKKEFTDEKNRRHVYEWINDVPLFAFEFTVHVNFFRYRMIVTDENGKEKTTYKNSWVTDLEITEENIETMVKGGRARWKIENECFNNLKNQGYHIEHNYGHGSQHLSFNFLMLILLAFFFHQIFELTDRTFQAIREKSSRREMWNNFRSYIKLILFRDWEQLLKFAFSPARFDLRLDTS